MKTIDELVREVAKNLDAVKPAPAAQTENKRESEKKSVHKTVPEAGSPESKLTLKAAEEIARAVETAAGIIGVRVVTAVRDEGANLVLLHAMDESYIASVQVAQDKAYTAVALKMPTHKALEESRGGALDGLTNGNGIMLLGGGYPLERNGKIYGGVGVSGGSKEQDTLLAAVAAQIFKQRFA